MTASGQKGPLFFFAVGNVRAVPTRPPTQPPPLLHCVCLALMLAEREGLGWGEGRVGLSTPGPLFLSDPHSGSFSM